MAWALASGVGWVLPGWCHHCPWCSFSIPVLFSEPSQRTWGIQRPCLGGLFPLLNNDRAQERTHHAPQGTASALCVWSLHLPSSLTRSKTRLQDSHSWEVSKSKTDPIAGLTVAISISTRGLKRRESSCWLGIRKVVEFLNFIQKSYSNLLAQRLSQRTQEMFHQIQELADKKRRFHFPLLCVGYKILDHYDTFGNIPVRITFLWAGAHHFAVACCGITLQRCWWDFQNRSELP